MIRKLLVICMPVILFIFVLGCGIKSTGEKGAEIISAENAIVYIDKGAIPVDARKFFDYRKGHAPEAVNIPRADIIVNQPYINMLAPSEQIEKTMSSRGISNNDMLLVYDDNNNMDSARLWWTLKIYGHHKVKVISGGYRALINAGVKMTTDVPEITETVFNASSPNNEFVATRNEVKKQVDDQEESTIIIDVRTKGELNREGTIPGSILIDHAGNSFKDGTYKPVQHIRIMYLENGIDYDKSMILFGKTSIRRGAQTYLALYNAGFRNLKLYDGAWVEWLANPMNPILKPEQPGIQEEESSGGCG